MELVSIPSGIFEHTNLREPLAEEVVVIDVAAPSRRQWNLRAPLDVDVHRSIRRNRLWQRHRGNRPVRRIAIVRRNEANVRAQVVTPVQRDVKGLDVGPTPCIRPWRRTVSAKAALTQPGGLGVAPRVPVEMELELARRICADVAPPDALAAVQRAVTWFEPHIDFVVGVTRRSRAWRRLVKFLRTVERRRQHERYCDRTEAEGPTHGRMLHWQFV